MIASIPMVDYLNGGLNLSPVSQAQSIYGIYGTSGFQFGIIMLAVGVICGFMIGWGIHEHFMTAQDSTSEAS